MDLPHFDPVKKPEGIGRGVSVKDIRTYGHFDVYGWVLLYLMFCFSSIIFSRLTEPSRRGRFAFTFGAAMSTGELANPEGFSMPSRLARLLCVGRELELLQTR
jgi:hypothetical protein